jgi:hypothetical protein
MMMETAETVENKFRDIARCSAAVSCNNRKQTVRRHRSLQCSCFLQQSQTDREATSPVAVQLCESCNNRKQIAMRHLRIVYILSYDTTYCSIIKEYEVILRWLRRHNALQAVKTKSTFRRNVSVPSSELKSMRTKKPAARFHMKICSDGSGWYTHTHNSRSHGGSTSAVCIQIAPSRPDGLIVTAGASVLLVLLQ